MKLLILSFIFSLSIYNESNCAQAFPTGAGGCDTGGAVEGAHLNNIPITTGSLATGNFRILLDGTTPLQPDTPTEITVSQMYTLSIVPSAGAMFRGALFRVAGAGVTLQPQANAQFATECTETFGVTHTTSDLKTDFKATLQVDGTEITIVDVTIVVANSGSSGSIYYYSQFLLQPTDSASTPMAIPTVVPVAAPMMVVPAPTDAAVPVATLTDAPIDITAPTNVPISIAEPTGIPAAVIEPTGTPVAVVEPTGKPATEPTLYAPVIMNMNMTGINSTNPVSSPVRAPTNISVPTPTGPSSFASKKLFSAPTS